MLKITRIDLWGKPHKNFLKYVTITIDDSIVIRGIKLIQRRESTGIMVAMPARRKMDDTYEDVVHPISKECRAELETQILKAYHDQKTEQKAA